MQKCSLKYLAGSILYSCLLTLRTKPIHCIGTRRVNSIACKVKWQNICPTLFLNNLNQKGMKDKTSGGADRIDTYPIRIYIQFLWIGTDRLSNPENLDRIGSDRQFFPLLSISNSGICLAWFFTKNPCNKCQNIGHCSKVKSAHLCDTAKSILSNI